jgi:hypothetical protein
MQYSIPPYHPWDDSAASGPKDDGEKEQIDPIEILGDTKKWREKHCRRAFLYAVMPT